MKPGAIIAGRIPKTAVSTANAACSVTTEAPGRDQRVYILGLSLSYSAAQTTAPLATVADSTPTTLENLHVYNVRDIVPPVPIAMTKGKAITVTLPAGGASVIGAITLRYYIGA